MEEEGEEGAWVGRGAAAKRYSPLGTPLLANTGELRSRASLGTHRSFGIERKLGYAYWGETDECESWSVREFMWFE